MVVVDGLVGDGVGLLVAAVGAAVVVVVEAGVVVVGLTVGVAEGARVGFPGVGEGVGGGVVPMPAGQATKFCD